MYTPPHFNEVDRDRLHSVIEENPLGILVTNSAGLLDANHIPFHLDRTAGESGTLACHVARQNPVWQELASGDPVLVVFRGSDAYISPQWYPSKQIHHRQVPTWNYVVAHVHGRVTIRDDPAFVRRNVALLTRHHEQGQPAPWKMGDAPRDYIDAMVQAIVGLEIEITRIEGKAKLSQNKDMSDIIGASVALTERGDAAIGSAMQEAASRKVRE
ncbi:FMN-binding negative transcriptional regulator [Paracoccus aurantiacus]|uniref:FMN-binding negative transcriptional regulator n=1 Tax=Paracoccus aurantiacus TaxID=2599412 RepID=A0A5C6S740_9RHOB|nr:FMN-binding negative transcriptional regulator [Paracoccus aurantiacus]TXB69592.1 FMN-binding negative transcriptional regulator [Paracoccus aurantiacus]